MAKIHPHRQNGVLVGYIADLGKQPTGNRLRKFFKTTQEAQAFIDSHKEDAPLATMVFDHKIEFIHAYNKLKEVGATIDEAVDFFLKHGARKGNPALQSVIEALLDSKVEVGRKGNYIDSLNKHFTKFQSYIGASTPIGDITEEKLKKYIFVEYNHANEVTKLNVIRNLSVLFNFAIQRKLIGVNPLSNIEKPKAKWEVPKVLSPTDFTTLLNRCYKKQWYDRLTLFVLVGFCGVRTEEASKLTWSDIDLENGKVLVPADVAKKARFRRNVIPPNALAWLKRIEDKRRTGPIIGDNWVALIRSAVKYAHINHTKNCLRHSFCSYALEAGWPLAEVVAYLGHSGSPAIINSHYRNIVEKKDADAWWSIVPPSDNS